MQRILRILGFGIIGLLILMAALGLWKREEITRLMAVNSLFDADRIVANFSTMKTMFLSRDMEAGDAPPTPLPAMVNPPALPPETARWISDRAVTALLVLKDGQIAHESYHLGTSAEDLRISWSMAKSFLSVLYGILLEEGAVPPPEARVAEVVPDLAGSAYDAATVSDVLLMSSGVKFDEDYLDYDSDINRMGRVLALGGSMDRFAAGLEELENPAGETWQYVSIDTHIIGMVIRAGTGRTIPDLLEEKVIRPMRLEADPYYLTDGEGTAFVLGGLNMRTRDYARMGLMIANDGVLNGDRIVSKNWIDESTAPRANTGPDEEGYGYQWWVPLGAAEGEVMARGIYGQYIWIDRNRNIVVATNGADKKFREDGVNASNVAMFRAIAATFD